MRAFVHSKPDGKVTISTNSLGWLLKQARLVELLESSVGELRWLWNYELRQQGSWEQFCKKHGIDSKKVALDFRAPLMSNPALLKIAKKYAGDDAALAAIADHK